MSRLYDEDALPRAVDRIYEAVERPELWPETLRRIGEFIGGRPDLWGAEQDGDGSVADVTRNRLIFGTSCHPTLFLSRQDLRILYQYTEEFGELVGRFLRIVFLSILWSPNDADAREGVGLGMARRYLMAFKFSTATSVASPSTTELRNLIAALWEDGHVFGSDHIRCMRLLMPHLDRALRLQMRLNSADLRAGRVSGALDRLTLGVVLVEDSGRPVWLNWQAREVIKHSHVLRLSSSGLVGEYPSDTRSLRKAINEALSQGTHGVLAIRRGDDRRPLLLTAIPLKPIGTVDACDQSVCGVVFISDPDQVDNPSVESLRQAFKLTHREAHVAIEIAQGHGLRAAADTMGVAITTARSQLQQTFAKTGTSHQAELAALVYRTLGHLRRD